MARRSGGPVEIDSAGSLSEPVEEQVRVTSLELFFDLVFVFTITQLTEVLESRGLGSGSFEAATMLGIIFYMYGGYVWLTNSVPLDTATRRVALLAGMLGYLVIALAVPAAYGDSSAVFGIAYASVVALHYALYRQARWEQSRRGIRAVAPSNAAGAVLVLAGGLAGGTVQEVLWLLAVAVLWITPLLGAVSSFTFEPGHFIERHGLVVLVAIGESVVAIGIGARGLPVDAALISVAALALGLNALLWWTYFGNYEGLAAEAFRRMPAARRGRAALIGYGHFHLALLGGVIAVAAGIAEVVAHPGHPLEAKPAIYLAAGLALFLWGNAALRRTLRLPGARRRALTGLAVLLLLPLGLELSGFVMLAAVVVLFAIALVRRPDGDPQGSELVQG
jgi:low temperature requirement protein LtrA